MRPVLPILFIFMGLVLANESYGQECFEGYETLFDKGSETMSYQQFHELELDFVKNLKGCAAPYFEGKTLTGDDIYLTDLKGKVVVLNFWFTTCPPCLKEIPELNKLVTQFNSDEVIFIGLARDTNQQLDAFFKRFGPFQFQIIPESYAIATTYKVVAWPQSMVIDANGKVFKVWAGADQEPVQLVTEIKTAIQQCLASGN